MQQCARCRAEMQHYDNGLHICPGCSVREVLTQEVLEATANKAEAFRKFEAIMLNVPSGLPQSDGIQRIKNACNELSIARKEMGLAYARLSDYVERGIVPGNLKPKVKTKS